MVRDDNSGPHKPEEIVQVCADLKHQFPNAQVIATNLTAIANAVDAYRANLPVIKQEIGDTWIHGIASDPLKVARYREGARLRQSWLAQQSFHIGDSTDMALLRHVLLEAEHTWGTDTKTLADFDHYTPHDLAEMLHTKNYEVVQHGWVEKRQDLFDGIATLPAPLRDQALASVRQLQAKAPQLSHPSSQPGSKELETAHFIVALDPGTGAITRLRNKKSGREWASADHPLALFSYQTLSQQDYARFFSNYVISTEDWAKKDSVNPTLSVLERKAATGHHPWRSSRWRRMLKLIMCWPVCKSGILKH